MAQNKSPLQHYLNTVKKHSLTREDEVALAKRIEKGDDKAKEKMVEENQALIISIAKKYRNYGLDFPDLIQEGNIGLMKATDRFDWRKGYKFSTYATWWIKQDILRAITNKSQTIRVPAHMQELCRNIHKIEREWKNNKGEKPTIEELSEELDTPEEKITKAKKASQNTTSLDKPLNENKEKGTALKDILETGENFDPAKEIQWEILSERLEKIMKEKLRDRERRILKLRYGLEDYHPRTLNEVGKVFDISRERVRQIQNRAIRKLQVPKIRKRLKALMTRDHT